MNFKIAARYTLLKGFFILFLGLSFVLRILFLIWNFSETDHSVWNLFQMILIGLSFDIGTISIFGVLGAIYFFALPQRFVGTLVDKIICYSGFSLGLLIIYFSFFAEITFWDEFQRRFNFIAVDYLIYTYEVVKNINESYPLPILIGGMLILVFVTIFIFNKLGLFQKTFQSKETLKERLFPVLVVLLVALCFAFIIKNHCCPLKLQN